MAVTVCRGTKGHYYDIWYTWKVTGASGQSLCGEETSRWARRKATKMATWRLGLLAGLAPTIEKMISDEVNRQLMDWNGPASTLRRQLADTVQRLYEHTQQPHKKVQP